MISNAYAQAAAAPTSGDTMMGLLPIIGMFVILYFLMIRPQMKRAKEQRTMVDALQPGDEVVALGIVGKIVKMSDQYLSLEVAPNTVIQLEKGTVNKLLPKGTIKGL